MTATTLLTDALAAYRLTRLVTLDAVTEPLRERVHELDNHTLSYLITCPHCTGMYAAALTTAARVLFPRVWGPVAAALASAALISIYAETRGE